MLLGVAEAVFDKLSLAMVGLNGLVVVYADEDTVRTPEAGENTTPFHARNNYWFKGGDGASSHGLRVYTGDALLVLLLVPCCRLGAGTIAHLCVFTARQQDGKTVLSFACPTNPEAARAVCT